MKNIFFNANHSPIGAYASFTLGFPGAGGGPGFEKREPAKTNVYVGVERKNYPGTYQCLPFYEGGEDESLRYDAEKEGSAASEAGYFDAYRSGDIRRTYLAASDTWNCEDLEFAVYNQVTSMPEPGTDDTYLKEVIVPAVLAELTIDNQGCDHGRRAFFGFDPVETHAGLRQFYIPDTGILGAGRGGSLGVFSADAAHCATGFNPQCILGETMEENWKFNLGKTAMLLFEVPANTKQTFRMVICFYRKGTATYGIEMNYYYTRFFDRIEAVAGYAVEKYESIKSRCLGANTSFDKESLSDDQRFMLWHAIRSYYNSSQLLIHENKPVWIINEGEFRMMNTMDLTVDQLFFEIRMNPWTVKNELDFYLENYSYVDRVRFPGDDQLYPGGLTFCHDMGVANIFTPRGRSSYEKCGIDDCFSYMSHEQVVNWLCCALVYGHQTKDEEWILSHMDVIKRCFSSMLNRDHPEPEKRNGVMGLDSDKTCGGAEITTYDSLDVSLGQARNNIYLAGKCWGVYVALEKFFGGRHEDSLAKEAASQAKRVADTIAAHMTEDGYIPAVLDENNHSKIIPAVEGLVFPYYTGCQSALDENGSYGHYIKALKRHFETIMHKGCCIFEDNGWKLSSTSNNSWLSKIYLCQFNVRKLLGYDKETYTLAADRAHVAWLTDKKLSYWCWSDQIISGVITASKYYPRGVTSILWLDE